MSESDQPAVHAQDRERVDPEERIRPMPILPAVIAVGMVLFGIIYIINSGPYTNPALGDHRTLADLRPQAAGGGAGGGAVDGGAIFAANCVACHQATGKGLPGVFPPLDGSDWVHGEPRVLANILLHGITGEIEVEGQKFNGQMPSFAQLSDAELAGVASYIRSSWSTKSEPIDAAVFAAERKAGAARTTPFEGGAALKALAATGN